MMESFIGNINDILPLIAALVATLLWFWKKFSLLNESISTLHLDFIAFSEKTGETLRHLEADIHQLRKKVDEVPPDTGSHPIPSHESKTRRSRRLTQVIK